MDLEILKRGGYGGSEDRVNRDRLVFKRGWLMRVCLAGCGSYACVEGVAGVMICWYAGWQ